MKAISKSGCVVMLAATLLAVAWSRARADVSITTCGQSVPAKQTGSLDTDLVCPSSANAVFLDDKATLTFNNHAISGAEVFCGRSCTLIGPGEVGQTSVAAIATGG